MASRRKRKNETDLRPCPFCGPHLCEVACRAENAFRKGQGRHTAGQPLVGVSYYVECGKCGARGPDEPEAVAARRRWNERATDRGAIRDLLADLGELGDAC